LRLLIQHRTGYRFSQPQQRLVQLLRVTPLSFVGQNVIDWQIDVDCNARLKSGRDGFGNETTMLYVDGPIDAIAVTVRGEVLTEDRAGMVLGAIEPLPPPLYLRHSELTRPGDEITAFAREIAAEQDSHLSTLHALMAALHEQVAFDPPSGDVGRGAADAFAERRGVCQDHAHIMIAAARSLGYPARYVSGHLWREGDGEAEQSATHAWAEVWLHKYGWIGFDPTNDLCPDHGYVRVAIGLDYRDAAPLSGARVGGGAERLEVFVRVDRLDTHAPQR
jgi:transglutaminase-like putative cysteine protease